jgi:hypothetical protein
VVGTGFVDAVPTARRHHLGRSAGDLESQPGSALHDSAVSYSDLPALRDYLDAHPHLRVAMKYFGTALPQALQKGKRPQRGKSIAVTPETQPR